MKRVLAVLALLAVTATMFSGCGDDAATSQDPSVDTAANGTCAYCKATGVAVRPITHQGDTQTFCNACYDTVQAMIRPSEDDHASASSGDMCDMCLKETDDLRLVTVEGESISLCDDCCDLMQEMTAVSSL